MTVLRREDVQSRVASWDRCPYRMLSPPILAIVPLIIRRLRGPSPNRITPPSPIRPAVRVSLLHRGGLECGPQKTRELARDRDGNLRCRLMFGRQLPEAPTQTLLRLVGDRNHSPRLPLAPSGQCQAVSTSTRRTRALPVRVMRPRRCFSPLESSPGTSPR